MHYNRKKKNLIQGCFVLVAMMVSARIAMGQSITNVDANQEGKSIAITYDLSETTDISLYITQDGGKTKTRIPLKFTSGDVGRRVKPGVQKKILWRVLDQYPNQGFQGENVSFIVKGSAKMRLFVALNAGYALDSGFNLGLMVGQLASVGWYAKVMATPLSVPISTDYERDESGWVGFIQPAYTGNANTFKAYGVAGVTVRLSDPLYLNAGVGYGIRKNQWETTGGEWVNNLPGSPRGFAIDAGLMGVIGNVLLSGGATLLLGSGVDVCFGVGYVF